MYVCCLKNKMHHLLIIFKLLCIPENNSNITYRLGCPQYCFKSKEFIEKLSKILCIFSIIYIYL